MRPQLPSFERLEPYLRRLDVARTYTNHGPLVLEFEVRVAACLGLTASLVTANSGTTALVAAILATAGRATAERPLALIPAYTFVATALAAEACGYRPYVLDVDARDWMLDAELAAAHPMLHRAGVVIAVAPYGRAVVQEPWRAFRARTGVPAVIDAAASFDVLAADRDLASRAFGSVPVALSFHATKSFATGEGGAVVCSDERVQTLAAQTLNLGFYGSRDCRVAALNGKMSEYHAAVGLAELDGWNAKHAASLRVAERYEKTARDLDVASAFATFPAISGCYALFAAPGEREAARCANRLADAGIGTRFWYGGGIHRHTHFAGVERDALPNAEAAAASILGLPYAPDLASDDIDAIVTAVAAALHER